MEQSRRSAQEIAQRIIPAFMANPGAYGVPAGDAPQLAALITSTAAQVGQPLDEPTRVAVEQTKETWEALASHYREAGQKWEPGSPFQFWGLASAVMLARSHTAQMTGGQSG